MEQADAWRMTGDLHAEHGKGDPFAAAIRATRMAMIITDPRQPDNPIVFANDAFLQLSGYGREEVLGRNCRFLQGPDTDRAAVARVRAAIERREDIHIDLLNYRKDGSRFWNALYLSPVSNESGELLYFFASQLDVNDRVLAQAEVRGEKERVEREVAERTRELREALEAKTVLLHEVDHRVKNNLQMISALILMQTRAVADPELRKPFYATLERVEALSTVHRRLYQSKDVSRFDVSAFASDLVHDLVGATGRTDIAVKLDVEPVEVAAEKAAPVALIINELVTNALKHAFVEARPGTIGVDIRRSSAHDVRISIDDDGVGIASEPLGNGSFGKRLIDTLGRQLQAKTTWRTGGPGTRIDITLPLEQPRRADHDVS